MAEWETVGRYRLGRELGRGMSGVVHLAEDRDAPDRPPVAVKRLARRADDEERRRFRREAELMATLRHPAVMPILEVVDDGDGLALVMPHAPGGSLRDRLREGRLLDAAALVATIAPVAEALDEAHRQGIVHRDVKPGNILFDAEDRPLLTDFGIARLGDATELTRTDTALGTAAYLAPEVADGADHSPATDLYGLAVTAYEALRGELPFRGATPLAVLRAADRGEHERLDPTVHGAVADVIERAMSRRPEDRHPHCAAFAAALRRAEAGQAPGAAPVGVGTELVVSRRTARRRPERGATALPDATTRPRRRIVSALIISALSAAIVGGGLLALSQRRSSRGGVVAFRPVCTASSTTRCLDRIERTPSDPDRLVVSFVDERDRLAVTLDDPADVVLAGNWFCGPTETLALYRPADGTLRYFRSWPEPGGGEVASVGDRTGVVGARTVSVGDRNGDGCSDVAIERADGERTWFVPVEQPGRLEPLTG